jgi:hypothetical protein
MGNETGATTGQEQLSLFSVLPPVRTGMTVEEARQKLDDNRYDKANTCPCCSRRAVVYRRPINAGQAVWLIELCKASGVQPRRAGEPPGPRRAWVDQSELPSRGGDYGKLIHWGLVEHAERDPEDKDRRTSGMWRPSELGEAFARNRATVSERAHLYLNQLLGFSGPQVRIQDCLGRKFSWAELWEIEEADDG